MLNGLEEDMTTILLNILFICLGYVLGHIIGYIFYKLRRRKHKNDDK